MIVLRWENSRCAKDGRPSESKTRAMRGRLLLKESFVMKLNWLLSYIDDCQIEIFPYSVFYIFFEQYLDIWETAVGSILLALCIVLNRLFLRSGLERRKQEHRFLCIRIVLFSFVVSSSFVFFQCRCPSCFELVFECSLPSDISKCCLALTGTCAVAVFVVSFAITSRFERTCSSAELLLSCDVLLQSHFGTVPFWWWKSTGGWKCDVKSSE